MIYIPFADHHPPPLVQFFETVTMIDAWLKSSPEHVAIIHCVGGKGRTGTIISALMFYDCTFATAEESADHFARSRSMLGRGLYPSASQFPNSLKVSLNLLKSVISATSRDSWLAKCWIFAL